MDNSQTLAAWLIDILKNESDYAPITQQTELKNLALDSLSLYELECRMQHDYGFSLDSDILINCRTVGDLISAVQNIAPRCPADQVALFLYREISGATAQAITIDVSDHLEELLAMEEKIFQLEIPPAAIEARPYIIAITNYLLSQISPSELNKRAELFLKLANNEI